MEYLGEMSALASAALWVVTGLAFAAAGRKVGATVVNVTRIWLALICLVVLHFALYGYVVPDLTISAWIWLSISGVLGLAIGDQFLYRSLVDAGPRTATLVMATVPGITAVIAWPVLGQSISLWGMVGMAVTLGGVLLVIGQQPRATGRVYSQMRRGVILAFLASICQSVGLVTSKMGMGDPGTADAVDPWTASLVRIAVATPFATAMLIATMRFMHDQWSSVKSIPRAWKPIVLGAICGPFLGVGTALVAVNYIDAGIAATLMATSPVMILPCAWLIEGEHFDPRALWGAAIAVLGVGILMAHLP